MRLGTFENKGPHGMSGKGLWIIAKSLKKVDKSRLVGVECRIGDATLTAHPCSECPKDRPGLRRGWPPRGRRQRPLFLKVADEQPARTERRLGGFTYP